MKKLLFLILAAFALVTPGCHDEKMESPGIMGEASSRAVVKEDGEVSFTNPELLTDWENVDNIVLNKTAGGQALTVTPPWCDGTMSALPESFRKDVKKEDGWTMLFHTFKQANNDVEQSYICLYNLFTGIIKVFYFYDGEVTATNSQWKFGVYGVPNEHSESPDSSSIVGKLFVVPTFLSYPFEEKPSNTPYTTYINNKSSGDLDPNAITKGWNGFEYTVAQYSGDLKSCELAISAINKVVTSYDFEGIINEKTAGIITSVTKTGGGDSQPITKSAAKVSGDKAKEFINGLYKSSTDNSGKTKLFKSLLSIAGNVASSGVMGAVKAGLGIIFGRTSAQTYTTTSDVNLTTTGDVTIDGTSSTVTTTGVAPVSFNLYDILHGHTIETSSAANTDLVYSLNSETKLDNLGVWTLESKPKVYWNLTVPFELYEPIVTRAPIEQDFYGTAPGPQYHHCECRIKFNPAIQPFISSCHITTKPFHTYLSGKDYKNIKWTPFLGNYDMLCNAPDKQIYSSQSNTFHIGMIPNLKGIELKPTTLYWFKWNMPQSFSTVVLVTVDINISYKGKTFTVTESRVFEAEDVEYTQPSRHNPPYDVLLNHDERGTWVHTISSSRIG